MIVRGHGRISISNALCVTGQSEAKTSEGLETPTALVNGYRRFGPGMCLTSFRLRGCLSTFLAGDVIDSLILLR